MQTADLSAMLRSGRDDKGEGRYGPKLKLISDEKRFLFSNGSRRKRRPLLCHLDRSFLEMFDSPHSACVRRSTKLSSRQGAPQFYEIKLFTIKPLNHP
jgi:hypothetical protein